MLNKLQYIASLEDGWAFWSQTPSYKISAKALCIAEHILQLTNKISLLPTFEGGIKLQKTEQHYTWALNISAQGSLEEHITTKNDVIFINTNITLPQILEKIS